MVKNIKTPKKRQATGIEIYRKWNGGNTSGLVEKPLHTQASGCLDTPV